MLVQVVVKVDKLTQEDLELIKRLLNSVNITEYEVINVKYYRCPSDKKVYIAFGSEAALSPSFYSHKWKFVILPELHQLHRKEENVEHRNQAAKVLKALAEELKFLDQPPGKYDYIPEERHLLSLYKYLKDNNLLGITGLTKNQDTIRISISDKDTEKADINVRFEELLALRIAKDLFSLTSVQFTTQKEKQDVSK